MLTKCHIESFFKVQILPQRQCCLRCWKKSKERNRRLFMMGEMLSLLSRLALDRVGFTNVLRFAFFWRACSFPKYFIRVTSQMILCDEPSLTVLWVNTIILILICWIVHSLSRINLYTVKVPGSTVWQTVKQRTHSVKVKDQMFHKWINNNTLTHFHCHSRFVFNTKKK